LKMALNTITLTPNLRYRFYWNIFFFFWGQICKISLSLQMLKLKC
jgi:hypothetical protein